MKDITKLGAGCLIIILLIVGFCTYKYYSWNHETENNVQKAGKYVLKVLKAKYHKDFEIKSAHFISNTGGYEFTVYPKNTPEFTFTAWLNGMTESGESDDYFLLSQQNEVKQMIAPYITEISSNYYISAVGLGTSTNGNEEDYILSTMLKNNMSEREALKMFPNKMYLDTVIHINYNITPENEDSVLKKVYKLIKFLKDKKFGSINIWVLFYDFPNKNLKEIAIKDINFSLKYPKKAKYTFSVKPEDVNNIHKYSDLKKYMREVSKINLGD